MAYYLIIISAVVAVLLAYYYYYTLVFNFWKKRKISGPKPVFFFGNVIDIMFSGIALPQYIKSLYETYTGSMIGLYMRSTPVLVLKDPELIKDVLIRDFSKFADRGFNVHERVEPLSQHLFNLEAKRWRPLRSKLTVFASSKLKNMFDLIIECANYFEKYLDKIVAQGEPVDFREITAKFTTDVIGSCAFGINMGALSDEESEFRKIGKQIFEPSLEAIIRMKFKLMMPKLYDLLGYIVPDRRLAPFLTKVVTDTMKYRKENNVYRPDFIHSLMQLKEDPEKLHDLELTDSLITAQAYVFFAAGFETGSTTMSNVLYELALNPKIQEKLREEINEHYKKHNGELNYEHIKDMEYLDKVFKETLRMYPPGTLIPRKSNSEYIFRDPQISIPKGVMIWIPVYAIHRDPEIYPNPDVFNPENFTRDAIDARHPMHYLPFGNGPRNCIGERFAVYQTKVGIITILRKYKVDVCEKTMIPYQFDPSAFLLAPKGGICLKITKI
ncbi:probable cytochrome P450 6a13 [Bombus fervidus]|uniref:probable cytochrome P450 6a13 n=1 Tax=Bombus fervidus TaxID=203811 RepID=UPI003AB24BAD